MNLGTSARAKSTLLRFAWLLLSLLLLVPTVARAQGSPPPVPYNVDERGVDLTTGRVVIPGPSLKIGPAGQHGLTFTWQFLGTQQLEELPTISGSSTDPVVAIDGRSIPFTGGTSSYTPVYQDGSTLNYNSGNYIFVGPDGTKIEFGHNGDDPIYLTGLHNLALATKVTYPDGTVRTFTWDTVPYVIGYNYVCNGSGCFPYPIYGEQARLSSINSSTGYQIKLAHSASTGITWADWQLVSGATAINNAVEYCDPTPTTCSLTNSWPTVSYTFDSQARIVTATDPASRTTTYSYNSGGLLSAIQPPGASSATLTICYWATTCSNGAKPTTLTINGVAWNYAYNSGNTVVTDPSSNATTYNYNVSGQFTSVVGPSAAGSPTNRFGYCLSTDTNCPLGLLKWAMPPEGTVDMSGNPTGGYTRYEYDPRGNMNCTVSIAKSPAGGDDLSCNPLYPSNGSKLQVLMGYPSSCADPHYCNKPQWTQDALAHRTDYNYDQTGSSGALGNLLSVVAPDPTGSAGRPTTFYSYGTRYAYYKNSAGALVAGAGISLPIQVSTCQTMGAGSSNPTSLPCNSVGTDERRTTIDYGSQTGTVANNLNVASSAVSIGGSSPATTYITYDIYARPVTSEGPLGSAQTSMVRYNLAGDVIGKVAPDPDDSNPSKFPATRYSYDSWGHAYLVEAGTVNSLSDSDWSAFSQVQNTLTEYDSYGRAARQKSRDSSNAIYQVADTVYDSSGRVQCSILRMDMSNYGSAPSVGTCASTTLYTGANGSDRVTLPSYDALGRQWKVTSAYRTADAADDQVVTFTNNGKTANVIDANGNRTGYSYDGFDRLTTTLYPNPTLPTGYDASSQSSALSTSSTPTGTDYEQVGYDANSNVTSFRTRANETLSLTYDNLGRLTIKGVPTRTGLATTYTRSVYYSYDLLGDMTNAMFDSATGGSLNEGVTNSFNALGQLTATTLAMDGSFSKTLSYQYDIASNLTRLTYPDSNYIDYYRYTSGPFHYADLNGVGPLFAPLNDANGRPSKLSRWDTVGGNWNQYTVINSYDGISRPTSIKHELAGTTYDTTTTLSYNPANQIISKQRDNDKYAWDGATTIAGRAYTSDGRDQYTAVGGTSFSYDADGNVTYAPDYAGTMQTYVYDVENRLVTRGGTAATMRYDPLGRLYEVVGSTGTTHFLYSGDALVAEYNSSGTLTDRYVHGEGADTPLVWFHGSGVTDSERRYLYADERGSIVAITDSSGNLLGPGSSPTPNSYDENGLPGTANNTGSYQSRFQYTGQAWIPEMAMYYYKARMYSPTLGRFMQTDPIGYGDGTNMYAYVHNDAINGADPTGLFDCKNPALGPPPQGTYCIGGQWYSQEELDEWLGIPITVTGKLPQGMTVQQCEWLQLPGCTVPRNDAGWTPTSQGGGPPEKAKSQPEAKCDSTKAAAKFALDFTSTTASILEIGLGAAGLFNLEDGVGEGLAIGAAAAGGTSFAAGTGSAIIDASNGEWGSAAFGMLVTTTGWRGATATVKFFAKYGFKFSSIAEFRLKVGIFGATQAATWSGGHCILSGG